MNNIYVHKKVLCNISEGSLYINQIYIVSLYNITECALYKRMQYSRGISEPEDLQVYDIDKRLQDARKTRRDEYL